MTELEIIKLSTSIIALMIAIIGHEIMHGRVAYFYKDNTAKSMGRLSINPLVHIDIVGTILLPAILYFSNAPFMFGWAKPVPINPNIVLANGKENGMIAVSLAGIAYNLFVAFIFVMVLHFYKPSNDTLEIFFYFLFIHLVIYNIVLAIFNLYPIPPLDGSKAVLYTALKFKMYSIVKFFNKIENYGMIILMLIIATPLSTFIFKPISLAINFILKAVL